MSRRSRRLNDTSALTDIGSGESNNISVRKIANGYVTSVSGCGPNGYHSEERFSERAPRIIPARIAGDDAGSESLSDTMRYLDKGD